MVNLSSLRRTGVAFLLTAAVGMLANCAPRTALDASGANGRRSAEDERADQARVSGDYALAVRIRFDATESCVKAYGEFSEPCADTMHKLGVAFLDSDDVKDGIGALLRAVRVREKLKGPKDLSIAASDSELGRGYLALGDFYQSSRYLTRAALIDTGKPERSTESALGALYWAQAEISANNDDLADAFLYLANKGFEKLEGPDGYHMAAVLAAQAQLARAKRDLALAGKDLDRAVAITEKSGEASQRDLADYLVERAEIYFYNADYANGWPLLLRAESILLKTCGPTGAHMARLLEVGATALLDSKGDFKHAEEFLIRALSIRQKYTAPHGPYVATVLRQIVELYWRRGDLDRALVALTQLEQVSEDTIANTVNSLDGSNDELVRFQPLQAHEMERFYAVALADLASSDLANRLALLMTLRRKGRLHDLLVTEVHMLRERIKATDNTSIARYLAAKRELSHGVFAHLIQGQPASTPVDKPENRVVSGVLGQVLGISPDDGLAFNDTLDEALRAQAERVTLETVAAKIPSEAALVEITEYSWIDWRKPPWPSEARYAAFVMWHDGRVAHVDLGAIKPIDESVKQLRLALADPSVDPKPAARALDEQVMRPIRALLGNTRTVFIAPDNALSLVPFGALVDERGEYLARSWTFVTLTTGRELLTLSGARPAPFGKSIVVADPDFGPVGENKEQLAAARGADITVLQGAKFDLLPGTAEEGRAVASVLGAQLLTGKQATREVLGSQRSPPILHVATHGFFLNNLSASPNNDRGLVLRANNTPAPQVPDALYRSGLVFAGANRGDVAASILTAREALSLDLANTQLVVLSACETGLGDTTGGQGVMGLQEAFVSAGARSLVMSLWKVDDEATRDLMTDFYTNLRLGWGPAAALRTAQLRMLGTSNRTHPYYWASFIQYGDPSPLQPGTFPEH